MNILLCPPNYPSAYKKRMACIATANWNISINISLLLLPTPLAVLRFALILSVS